MENSPQTTSDLEKYEKTLEEIRVLEAKILLQKEALDELLSTQSKHKMLLESINDKRMEELINNTKQVERYKAILNSASIFTLTIILSVAVNIFSEQLLSKDFPILPIAIVIGLVVLGAFAYKSWLDYSAQQKARQLKDLFEVIEQKNK